jgi:hypothetical protein
MLLALLREQASGNFPAGVNRGDRLPLRFARRTPLPAGEYSPGSDVPVHGMLPALHFDKLLEAS